MGWKQSLHQVLNDVLVAIHAEAAIGLMSRGPAGKPPRVSAREKYASALTAAGACVADPEHQLRPAQVRLLEALVVLCKGASERLDADCVAGQVTTLAPCDSLDEFLALFGSVSLHPEVTEGKGIPDEQHLHESIHEAIRERLKAGSCNGAVMFENLSDGAPEFGKRTAIFFGPGCTMCELQDVADLRLGDEPKEWMHPIRYFIKP
jgi:hypothetical protein